MCKRERGGEFVCQPWLAIPKLCQCADLFFTKVVTCSEAVADESGSEVDLLIHSTTLIPSGEQGRTTHSS